MRHGSIRPEYCGTAERGDPPPDQPGARSRRLKTGDWRPATGDRRLAEYLDWERRDYEEAVEGMRRGLDDVRAGRTEPADTFLDEFARKHGLPR